MQNGETTVSVLCLTYNHEKFIADAIDSFLKQKTDFKLEIIVHDDASPDGTADIVREYEKKYPDIIKPIYQNVNQYSLPGSSFAAIIAITFAKSSGKYIAICEGDDYWTDENKLQMQFDYMETHEDCSFCFHSAEVVNPERQFQRVERPYTESKICTAEDALKKTSMYPTASYFMRADYLHTLFEEKPDFFYNCATGDTPMPLFFSTKGYLYYMDRQMSAYRVDHPASWNYNMHHNGDVRENYKKARESVAAMYRLFDEYSGHKYPEAVDFAVHQREFQTLESYEKYREIRKPPYRQFYKMLPLKRRLQYSAILYFPYAYGLLKKIKHRGDN